MIIVIWITSYKLLNFHLVNKLPFLTMQYTSIELIANTYSFPITAVKYKSKIIERKNYRPNRCLGKSHRVLQSVLHDPDKFDLLTLMTSRLLSYGWVLVHNNNLFDVKNCMLARTTKGLRDSSVQALYLSQIWFDELK